MEQQPDGRLWFRRYVLLLKYCIIAVFLFTSGSYIILDYIGIRLLNNNNVSDTVTAQHMHILALLSN